MTGVLDLPYTLCIWISAAVVIIYTLLGGLYSVAYTDIIQLVLVFISLVSCCSLRFYKVLESLFITDICICLCSGCVFPLS